MNNNIKNWINKNIIGYEYNKTVDNRHMVFIPVINNQDQKIKKYLKRIKANFKADYRADYTYLCIIFNWLKYNFYLKPL